MIYISGSISKNKNWERDFIQAEKILIDEGFRKVDIVNPLQLAREVESRN